MFVSTCTSIFLANPSVSGVVGLRNELLLVADQLLTILGVEVIEDGYTNALLWEKTET